MHMQSTNIVCELCDSGLCGSFCVLVYKYKWSTIILLCVDDKVYHHTNVAAFAAAVAKRTF